MHACEMVKLEGKRKKTRIIIFYILYIKNIDSICSPEASFRAPKAEKDYLFLLNSCRNTLNMES